MTTLTNAKAFKGILQYKSTDNFTKEVGYVYFIREFNEKGEETGNAEIYFGNRKYGDVNTSQLSEIESILETKLDSNSVKTINNESLVGDGNIVVGNIASEEDDSLSVDDVNTNTYVKYVAQTLTEEQKNQVKTNIGAITDIIIDSISNSPSNGVVNLGYANKQRIPFTESTITLQPNVYYKSTNTSMSSFTFRLGSITNTNIINEYFIEFTTSSSGTTVTLPSIVKWVDGVAPTFEAGYTYQISIVDNLGTYIKFA